MPFDRYFKFELNASQYNFYICHASIATGATALCWPHFIIVNYGNKMFSIASELTLDFDGY